MASNKMDDECGKEFATMLEHNWTLIDFDFNFNHFSVPTTNKIVMYLRRNVAKFKSEKLKEWKERKLMREEDADLHKLYL